MLACETGRSHLRRGGGPIFIPTNLRHAPALRIKKTLIFGGVGSWPIRAYEYNFLAREKIYTPDLGTRWLVELKMAFASIEMPI